MFPSALVVVIVPAVQAIWRSSPGAVLTRSRAIVAPSGRARRRAPCPAATSVACELVASGALDAEGAAGSVRIAAVSVQRRRIMPPPVGTQMASLSAWAILALASGDAPFLMQVAGLLSDPDRSRARARLHRLGLLALLPRLRGRATARMFVVPTERLVELLADPRLVLGGSSAAQLLGWALPAGPWPVEAYVLETELVPIVEQYALERSDHSADLLRTVQEPWPFGPHRRVVSTWPRRPTPVWSSLVRASSPSSPEKPSRIGGNGQLDANQFGRSSRRVRRRTRNAGGPFQRTSSGMTAQSRMPTSWWRCVRGRYSAAAV
jgi:hypothetical protein